MKTFSAKPKDVVRKWYVLDASKLPLGRLATNSARLLLGKDKPSFTPHVDGGDYVIIINADQLVVTGDKLQAKTYFRHSGFPGGLHQRSLNEAMQKNSAQVITKAIRGMLPDNKLRAGRLVRLKVYSGSEHGHNAQNPVVIELGAKGSK